mmetsp:Transcript_21367/g.48154  ORF Transcript_21367/g.48154 Transcript_21367/m.48154 type:complete len:311 (+) Transcript_21367:113-1045(+)
MSSVIKVYSEALVASVLGVQRAGAVFGLDLGYVSEKELRRNAGTILAYKGLGVSIVLLMIAIGEHTLASLMLAAATIQAVAFAVLLRSAASQPSALQGVSLKMLVMYGIAIVCRLQSTLFYYGYLPISASAGRLLPYVEIGTLGLVAVLFYQVRRWYRLTASDHDSCWVFWMPIAALVIAKFTHPVLNHADFADIMWTAAVWLEAMSLMPQVWLAARTGIAMDKPAAHFLALTFVARCFCAVYWLETYEQLKIWRFDYGEGVTEWFYPGYFVLAAYSLQLLGMADFLYLYICGAARRTGAALALNGIMEL